VNVFIVKLMSFTVSLRLVDCLNFDLHSDCDNNGLESISSWKPDEGHFTSSRECGI
jgi:hypothetical protein